MTTLVFTHGYASSAETWRHQVEHFQKDHTVIAWDLRGHGCGPAEGPFTPEQGQADLLAVIDGAVRPVLAGHSLGGYMSLRHALEHPVAGLVLLATGPGYRDPAGRQRWNEGALSRYADEERVGLLLQHDSVVMDRIGEITVPVLVIVGEKDKRFHSAAEWFARSLPSVETFIVPEAGHHVHEHQPAAVNTAIDRFLSSLPQ